MLRLGDVQALLPAGRGRGRFASLLLLPCVALLFAACAKPPLPQPSPPPPPPVQKEVFTVLPEKYRTKALEHENRGELREAMLNWWIVQNFYPHDKEIAGKIEKLHQEIRAKAAAHFQSGISFYEKGLLREARREFLRTLMLEPYHSEALSYLQSKLHDDVFKPYTVQEGDTLVKIAGKVYRDSGKTFLITAFNGIGRDEELKPGSQLKMVVLDEKLKRGRRVAGATADDGVQVLDPGSQRKKIAGDPYGQQEDLSESPAAEETADTGPKAAAYRQAVQLIIRQDYVEALRVLRTIGGNYLDVSQLISSTEASLRQQVESHYRKGISYYLSEELDKAVAEWEEVLRLDPSHLKAQKDLLNARKLQQKIKKF
ncbi:MAG: tetratricopeptide repeat protein [Deltaproteobacteria bacterium]|nr:tetratricopeptide repeat protein [Deltaproteobacteria bacterium]